ncbi:hypothetical protein [Collimonas silvisoli]|uniref:hypothetical protein n=1 Tax=Collimonas silvisoli TaxID=2825884 RepID=UPI001B8D6838|nr:hypothetical protein [Collimonas silvisoli]
MQFLLLLFFFIVGLAQAAPQASIQSLTFQGKTERGDVVAANQIMMPFVTMTNQKVAAKINDYLFNGQFGVLAPRQPGKVFSAADGVAIDGMASQEFSVSRNDGRILTIAFENEGCGAYCENYQTYYSFDIKTGRMLDADDVFTASGMRALERRMVKERQSQYRELLISLRSELKAIQKAHDAKSQDTVNDLKERIELNSNCSGEGTHTDRTPGASEAAPMFKYYKSEFSEDAFKLTAERCSNHAMRALDDVGAVTLTIPYAELKPYLTGYGTALLLNQGSTTAKSSVYGQFLRGRMDGKIAITMLLYKEAGDAVRGIYFYDKYRKPISVAGRENGNQLELTEAAADGTEGTEKAKMQLTVTGDHLQGRWIGKTEFQVELAP